MPEYHTPLTSSAQPGLYTRIIRPRTRLSMHSARRAARCYTWRMPIYEYFCPDCAVKFEELRAIKAADGVATCPQCAGEHAARVLSLFFAASGGPKTAAQPVSMGGACCGGGCGCGPSQN